MNIKELKTFCAVVQKGSFSQAADVLSLTQPTISFQISSLEKELETKLLDRGGRQMMITKSGEILYQYALNVLELTQQMKGTIEQLKGLVRGELIIAASTIPGEYILPGLLSGFKERYPGVEIILMVTDTKGVIKKVTDNEVEVGAVGAKEGDNKLVFTKFATDRLVLIAPSDERWFKRNTISLDELRGVPFIMREDGSGTRTIVRQKLKDMGMREKELSVVMKLGSTAAVKKAVESGAGVSVISERAAETEIKLGLLRKVQVKNLKLDRDFFIVYKWQKTLSPAAAAFLQFLQQAKEPA